MYFQNMYCNLNVFMLELRNIISVRVPIPKKQFQINDFNL